MHEEEAKQKYKAVLTIVESEWLACEGLYLFIYLFFCFPDFLWNAYIILGIKWNAFSKIEKEIYLVYKMFEM